MHTIAIVIFDDFTDIDFFLIKDILGRTQHDWVIKVLGTKPSHRSVLGNSVTTDGHITAANDADAVIFSSGQRGIPTILVDQLFMSSFKLDPTRQLIGSICAGSFILAQLGLLDGKPATTHPDAMQALLALGVDVQEKPLVIRGNIATAGGCLSALYLTGWLAERLYNPAKRREIHRQLLPAGQEEIYERLIQSSIDAAYSD